LGQTEGVAWLQTRDDLTQLLTRAAFTRDLNRRGAAAYSSLLLLDLDHLKLLNDTLGHPAGDEQLRRLGQALRTLSPPSARAYRLGGDEFALLSGLGGAALSDWAQEFVLTLRRTPERPISVSGGIVPLLPGDDPDERVACADRRLYQAKQAGRGQVISSDQNSPFTSPTHRLLERDDQRARATRWLHRGLIESGELSVYAAPGAGLSAFMAELEIVARHLGFQTLLVGGDPVRRCRPSGAWHTARLDGIALESGELITALRGAERPLAVLLDTPEHFDTETNATLQSVLDSAQAIIRGHGDERRPGRPGTQLNLPPLSQAGVLQLGRALGESLSPEGAEWLHQRSAGCPAPLLEWLSALRLEARLRRLSTAALAGLPAADWEDAVARHLPARLVWPRPPLYGRQLHLQQAVTRLRYSPLLTITGPPGRGKTRFAEQLLGELSAQFSGGGHLVSLAGLNDAGLVLARITQTLIGQSGQDLTPASLGRLLARRPTLLVLDDASSPAALDAASLEAVLGHSSLTRLVVLAPEALGVSGESTLLLPPLEPSAVRAALSQTLISRRSGTATQAEAAEQANLDELVSWVAGEARRLETALAQLRVDELKGAAGNQLGSVLESSLTALALQQLGGPEPDQGAGWQRLGADERARLAALSNLDGPFTLSWAAQVSGASSFLLSALRDQAYLHAEGSGLYRLPNALARQAGAELRRLPERAAQLAAQTLTLLGQTCTAQAHRSAAWFTQLDTVYPSLRSTLAGLRRTPPTGRADQLRADPGRDWAEVVLALTPYRLSRGDLHEARADLAAVAFHLPDQGDILPLRLRLAQVQVGQHLGIYEEQDAELKALPLRHPLWPAAALIEARSLHRRSLYQQSQALFGQVARHPDCTPSQRVAGLDGQARSTIYRGDLPAAWALISLARQETGHLDDPLLSAGVLNTAALIATEQRDLPGASDLFGEALEIHRTFGDQAGATLNLTGLAWASLLGGDAARSAELSRQVLRQAQDAGNLWELANALINLGHALSAAADHAQARSAYLEGIRLAWTGDMPSLVAEALAGLAGLRAVTSGAQAYTLLELALNHPGANAECRRFFAPLEAQLGTQVRPAQRTAAVHPEDRALLLELELLPPDPVGERPQGV
jgi:diguanylate cyclase (GGDEF)-like protein